MKIDNIIKKLEKEGYKVQRKPWGYYSNVPHVKLNGFEFTIVEGKTINGSYSINMDFVYNHVLDAIMVAEGTNELLLQMIRDNPSERYFYIKYLLLSMQDYYNYKKELFPWDNWKAKWKQLNREWLYS